MDTAFFRSHYDESAKVLNAFIEDEQAQHAVLKAADLMVDTLRFGGKIMSCGNGGSHCDAMHFAEELSGRYRENRPAIAALNLGDPGHITCVGNDYGFEHIYSRAIEALGKSGDCLLAISTSGNSKNIIQAAKSARTAGITVIGLTGNSGGELSSLCDVEIRVPHTGYADRIQEIHIKVIHSWISYVENTLYPA